MDIPLRQRLVGALVLVALAAILLPIILDGAGRRDQEADSPVIPPEPPFTHAIELPAVESSSSGPASIHEAPARREAVAVPLLEPLPKAPVASPESPDTSIPRPAALAWVVQIGSFSEAANAVAESERLRAAGYSSFVEPYTVEGRDFFRVKIGPESRRQDAEALAARLAEQEKIKGIVVTHP